MQESQRIQVDTEEKLVIASKKARAEARQRESKLSIARSKVKNARYIGTYMSNACTCYVHLLSLPLNTRDQLSDTDHKAEVVHAKICKAQASIKGSKERTQEYGTYTSRCKYTYMYTYMYTCTYMYMYEMYNYM